MKKLFILFCSLSWFLAEAQTTKLYYLEIPVKADVPTVTQNGNGTVTLSSPNKPLNTLLKQYKVVTFEPGFPEYKTPVLKTVYFIECEPILVTRLRSEFGTIFTNHEETDFKELLLPNDYNPTIAGTSYVQHDLALVNAPAAWDISTGDTSIVGNSEPSNPTQADLLGKCENVFGTGLTGTASGHGTSVAVTAVGSTNNGTGIASMGYNTKIKTGGGSYGSFMTLALNGARAINMSWVSSTSETHVPGSVVYGQLAVNELYNMGVVLIAAAGNGVQHGATAYTHHYPASLDNVISVTNIGSQYDVGTVGVEQKYMKDIHDNATGPFYATHNERVDLSAPGKNILTVSTTDATVYTQIGGTSLSAPMVMGAVGLMFDVNECLWPIEVESILKLTAFKNDLLPLNLPWQGWLGAGSLRADQAVDMAKDMALPFGTVEVKNRLIDRWNFVLKTNPYEIELSNNVVSNTASLDFTARNNVEILSGDYAPTGSGFVDLKIHTVATACNTAIPDPSPRPVVHGSSNSQIKVQTARLYPNPNTGNFGIAIDGYQTGDISITIIDVLGKVVWSGNAKAASFDVNATNLPAGMYFVKLHSDSLDEILKFIKK